MTGLSTAQPSSIGPELDDARRRSKRAAKSARDRADLAVAVLVELEFMVRNGEAVTGAICTLAATHEVSSSAIEKWRQRVKGVPRSDWRAVLTHRSAGTTRERFTSDHPYFATFYTHYWANQKQPPLSSALRRMERDRAAGRLPQLGGVQPLSADTIRRILRRDIEPGAVLRKREGKKAQRRAQVYHQRDRSDLVAYQVVVGDGHCLDFVIVWQDGSVGRPECIAMLDEYSGYALSYELDRSENVSVVRRCLKSMLRKHGLPDEVLFDNGAGFIAKELTGQARNRYRGKDREGEIPGALVTLGVEVGFIEVERPELKGRVERLFGLLEKELRADPEIPEGAYVGNAPHRRPELAGTEPMPEDLFRKALDRAFAAINSRDSRGHNCHGRSPEATFQESYHTRRVPIPFQRDDEERFLMLPRSVTPRRHTFEIELLGNRYHDPDVAEAIRMATGPTRRQVTIYHDPDADGLHERGILVYTQDGRQLGWMGCVEKIGYRDREAARDVARDRKALRKSEREQNERLKRIAANAPARVLDKEPALKAAVEKATAPAPRPALSLEDKIARFREAKRAEQEKTNGRQRNAAG